MAFYINTNIASFNAQRSLGLTQARLATSYQRLSSGLRINSAKDDPAGLAISTRLTTQIYGLEQGKRNASNGISLAQTSEGALDEITQNLQKMRQIALQAINGSNSPADRWALNAEVAERLGEVTRIAIQTNFNGMKVLDGSGARLSFQVGANVGDIIEMSIEQGMRADQVGHMASGAVDIQSHIKAFQQTQSPATDWSEAGAAALDVQTYDGVQVNWTEYKGGAVEDAREFLQDKLGDEYKISIDGQDLKVEGVPKPLKLAKGELSIATSSGERIDVVGSFRSVQEVANALNAHSRIGLSAFVGTDGKLNFNSRTDLGVSGTRAVELGFASGYAVDTSASLADGSVLTKDGANALIARIDATLESVSSVRSKLGAVQGRLESTVRNLDNIRENLTKSRTVIRDADMAEVQAEKTIATILEQAGISVLAQANMSHQLVLKLLE
ncbi:MAG: flagellin N-terminal helical domain-containing protein [Luteibacter jiangsuensis]